LSGQSKTLMLVQASPQLSDLSESICTLRFAERVRATKVGVAKKNEQKGDYAGAMTKLAQVQKELKMKSIELEELQKVQRIQEKKSEKSNRSGEAKVMAAQEEANKAVAAKEKQLVAIQLKKQELEDTLQAEQKARSQEQQVIEALKTQLEEQMTAHKVETDAKMSQMKQAMEQEMAAEKAEMDATLAAVMKERNDLLNARNSTPVRNRRRSSLGVAGALEEVSNIESPSALSPGDAAAQKLFGAEGDKPKQRRKSHVRKSWVPLKEVPPMEQMLEEEESSKKETRPKTSVPTTNKAPARSGAQTSRRLSKVAHPVLATSGRALRVPMSKAEHAAQHTPLRSGAKRVTRKEPLPTFKF